MADENEGELQEHRPFNIEGALNSLIARNNNDARMALRTLSEDNYQYRRQIRNLKKQIADLSKRPELKEGERVVSGERFKTLTDFEALKVKVEDVQTGLTERDTLKAKEAERKEYQRIENGVKPLKMNPEVLADLITTRKFEHELRDVEVEEDGEKKTIQVLHLRKPGTETFVRADKFAERELKGYLPALRIANDDASEEPEDGEEDDTQRNDDDQPRRQPFPKQASGTGSKAPRTSADVVSKHIAGRYALPSKLRETQNQ